MFQTHCLSARQLVCSTEEFWFQTALAISWSTNWLLKQRFGRHHRFLVVCQFFFPFEKPYTIAPKEKPGPVSSHQAAQSFAYYILSEFANCCTSPCLRRLVSEMAFIEWNISCWLSDHDNWARCRLNGYCHFFRLCMVTYARTIYDTFRALPHHSELVRRLQHRPSTWCISEFTTLPTPALQRA